MAAIGDDFRIYKCWPKYKARAGFFLTAIKDLNSMPQGNERNERLIRGLNKWTDEVGEVFEGSTPELVRQSQSYQEYVALIESIKDDIEPRLFNALIVF